MERRSLLKALGSAGVTGFAGCTARARGDGGNRSSGLKRRLVLVGQDSVPAKYDLNIDATVVDATSTKRHPATVKITATNTGSKRQIGIGTGRDGLFNRSYGGSAPDGLWLHLTGRDAPMSAATQTGPPAPRGSTPSRSPSETGPSYRPPGVKSPRERERSPTAIQTVAERYRGEPSAWLECESSTSVRASERLEVHASRRRVRASGALFPP